MNQESYEKLMQSLGELKKEGGEIQRKIHAQESQLTTYRQVNTWEELKERLRYIADVDLRSGLETQLKKERRGHNHLVELEDFDPSGECYKHLAEIEREHSPRFVRITMEDTWYPQLRLVYPEVVDKVTYARDIQAGIRKPGKVVYAS